MSSDKMRAITLKDPGPNGRLEMVELSRPTPQAGEVLIEVVAAGLNHADLFQVQGNYPPPVNGIPGLEVSGRIAAMGEGVQGFFLGQEVCALLKSGGYAEYVAAPAGQVLPIPVGTGLVEGASLPEALGTVWLALFQLGRLQAGEQVVIHGAASGIGSAAIQLARLTGARVIATARSPLKRAHGEALGAVMLEATSEGFAERARAATSGKGADLLLDMLGGAFAPEHLAAMAPRGRIVTIALQAGKEATLPLGKLLLNNLTWHGMTLGSRSVQEKSAILSEMRARVWPWIEAGEYRLIVDRTYLLAQAAEAHAAMQRGDHKGKILLVTGR